MTRAAAALSHETEAETRDSRRMHERVRGYWQSVKEQRRFPQESEIEPAVIADAWDYCFLVDMSKGAVKDGFRYDYMGKELINAYGMDMTSLNQCDASTAPHIASILRHFDQVAESGEPAMDEAEFENIRHVRIKYRCCLLPLGRDRVEYILGCMRWKEC